MYLKLLLLIFTLKPMLTLANNELSFDIRIIEVPESIKVNQLKPHLFISSYLKGSKPILLTGKKKILDLTYPAVSSSFSRKIKKNCGSNFLTALGNSKCFEQLKEIALKNEVDFIALPDSRLNSPNCSHRAQGIKLISLKEPATKNIEKDSHFNFRCDFNFPHELFLFDYFTKSIEDLVFDFQNLSGSKTPLEITARRFIDRKSIDRAKRENIQISQIYSPAPLTWESWFFVAANNVHERALQEKPLSLSDLEGWNYQSLVDIQSYKGESIKDLGKMRKGSQLIPHFHYKNPINNKELNGYLNFKYQFLDQGIEIRWTDLSCKGKYQEAHHRCGKVYFPDSHLIPKAMESLIEYANNLLANHSSLSLEQKFKEAINLPVQLTAMHPFYDGNGRVAKWLQDYMSTKMNLPLIIHYEMNQDITSSKETYFQNAKRGTLHSLITMKRCQLYPESIFCN